MRVCNGGGSTTHPPGQGNISRPAGVTKSRRFCWPAVAAFIAVLVVGCRPAATVPANDSSLLAAAASADDLLIVDCLLPGQIRRMGSQLTYLSQRRPIRTSGSDCAIRGGEYVAYDRANYATALKYWLPLAQQGDANAQTYVGEIFEKGLGQAPDYPLAVQWYAKAAQQGYSRAQINLGHLYEKGLGVAEDKKRALDLYRLASGLKDDRLLYASTLNASYVPRERYQALAEDLQSQRRQNRALQQTLANHKQQLANSDQVRMQAEQQLRRSLQNAQNLRRQPTVAIAPAPVSDRERQLQTQLERLQSQQAQLQQQIKSLTTQSRLSQRDRDELQRQLNRSLQEAEDYRTQLTTTSSQLSAYDQQLAQSQQQLDQLREELKFQQRLDRSAEQQRRIAALEKELQSRTRKHQGSVGEFNDLKHQNQLLQQQLAALDLRIEQQQALTQQQADVALAESTKLQMFLTEKEQQLQDVEHKLLLNQAALEIAHSEYLKQVSTLSAAHQQQLDASKQEIAGLTEALQNNRRQQLSQQQQIERLNQQLQSSRAPVEELARLEPPPIDVPSIEIIDPPIVLTRSVPGVRLRDWYSEREVIGKVSAPAGLLSFKVNGQNADIGSNNLFRVKVALTQDQNPVSIVAIDQQGRRVAVNFSIFNPTKQTAKAAPDKPAPSNYSRLKLGEYHALVIGNNDYAHLSTLKTAVADARETERLLREKYGFKTRLLLNANRYQILSALNTLRAELNDQDNLLIYYAGHGKVDDLNRRSYWLPVDAEENNNANWISSSAITDFLNAMAAKHVMVVADSCYAGNMTQSSVARVEMELPDNVREQWIQTMASTRARLMLTSGSVQPVLDGGGGEHSVFAKAFIQALQANDRILEGFNLYYRILSSVPAQSAMLNQPQVPQYAPIHLAGHEAGEFFFRPI